MSLYFLVDTLRNRNGFYSLFTKIEQEMKNISVSFFWKYTLDHLFTRNGQNNKTFVESLSSEKQFHEIKL